MDGLQGHSTAVLTRSKSSLFRSSPIVRSSIHSMDSIAKDHLIVDTREVDVYEMEEDDKKNRRPRGRRAVPPGSIRFRPAAVVPSLVFSDVF